MITPFQLSTILYLVVLQLLAMSGDPVLNQRTCHKVIYGL